MDYKFPLGIAKDEYFCNRISETADLIQNIKTCTHTVLVSPRRYGKTSLAYRAIGKSQIPHIKIDLYMSTGPRDVERAIIKGVNGIISQVTGVTEKILNSIKGYVTSLRPTLIMGSDGINLTLEATDKTSTSENICEALRILDAILSKKNQKAVLLIDEFQEVERVAKDQGIEGAIRNVAQETQHFSIIFSGSKRNLLKSMFNNRNKPLYRLCDEIVLERIHGKDYSEFLDQFAQTKWQQTLSIDAFNQILSCTERHPYYFNVLLRILFSQGSVPTVKIVQQLWDDLAGKKRNDLLSETKALTVIQKKLLISIAGGKKRGLTGKDFLSESKLASASVVRALDELLDEDFIEKIEGNYELVDPLLKTAIKQLNVS
jgi:uncharacterized protein